jgi:hypothetical protein
MGTGIYLWHGQFLSRDRACQALSDMFGCAPSPGALAAAARKTAGFLAPALAAITRHLIAAEVVHFDETGFRTAGKLAWVHSASAGKFALFTVHAKRGKDGMKAAGSCRPSPASPSTTPGHPTTPSRTSQATPCVELTSSGSSSRSPRPARTSTKPGHSRPSTRCSP